METSDVPKPDFLILSIFGSKVRQTTVDLARQRNTFVAAIADRIFVAHAAEGSRTLEFAKTVSEWGKPIFTFDTEANRSLRNLGGATTRKSVNKVTN